jgi:hypothetical protein
MGADDASILGTPTDVQGGFWFAPAVGCLVRLNDSTDRDAIPR